jgi:hypothetical protein
MERKQARKKECKPERREDGKEARNKEQRFKEKQTRKGGKKLRKHNNKEEGRCLCLVSDHRKTVKRRRGEKLRAGFETAAAVFASTPEQSNNRHADNRQYFRHCLNCTLPARYARRANRMQTGGR